MTRHLGLAFFVAVALALLVFALWLSHAASDVPVSILQDAGMQVTIPQSEFEAIRSAGITVVGTSNPSPALLHAPKSSPAPSPAPATLVAPSTRPRVASVRTAGAPSGPTDRRSGSVTGISSWFNSPAGVSAAGPALRTALGLAWRGTRVTVTGPAGSTVVVLGDFMRADRLIDLDAPMFVRVCGALSRGLCRVEVTW